MECAFAMMANVEASVERAVSAGSAAACEDAVEEFMMLVRLGSLEASSCVKPRAEPTLAPEATVPTDEELLKLTYMFTTETSEISDAAFSNQLRPRGAIKKSAKSARRPGAHLRNLTHVGSEVSIQS
mmetsp:Transcript_12924/g.34837  ORF Transcript_12924/g.34837 Transcript_12924/m.34837 type:complete len:127 (+) Transcript_12924:175-555(+)